MDDLVQKRGLKRRAAHSITKDDVDNYKSDEEEREESSTGFKKADPSVIAQRQKLLARRSGGTSAAPKHSFGLVEKDDTPTPSADLVPKPSVAKWTPVALNFGAIKPSTAAPAASSEGAKPAESAEAQQKSAASSTASGDAAPASSVPKAFSVKPFSFSNAIGKPPMPSSSEKSAEGEAKTSAAAEPTAAQAVAPLLQTGFKFTTSTNWGFPKKSASAESGTNGAPQAAPATTMKWNFLGKTGGAAAAPGAAKTGDFKPAPLSSHFTAKSTGAFGGLKTNFQFGKNVAPAKAGEPSKEVLQSLERADAAPAKSLADATPVETLTGEEEENVLFEAEAKLHQFDLATKAWVERGVGTFRLNQLKSDASRYRLVMHLKTTLRIILNSPLYIGMNCSINEKQASCVKFSAIPIPVPVKKNAEDGSATTEETQEASNSSSVPAAFTVRFRDSETAAKSLKSIKDALANKESLSTKNGEAAAEPSSEKKTDEPSQPASAAEPAAQASAPDQVNTQAESKSEETAEPSSNQE